MLTKKQIKAIEVLTSLTLKRNFSSRRYLFELEDQRSFSVLDISFVHDKILYSRTESINTFETRTFNAIPFKWFAPLGKILEAHNE